MRRGEPPSLPFSSFTLPIPLILALLSRCVRRKLLLRLGTLLRVQFASAEVSRKMASRATSVEMRAAADSDPLFQTPSCSEGTTLESVDLQRGWWRISPASIDFRPCPDEYVGQAGGGRLDFHHQLRPK